jgi:glycosyltransferase involved in cell wall biosynthesis
VNICILSAFEDTLLKDTGASIRIYNLAKGLSSKGNRIKLILPKNQTSIKTVDGMSIRTIKGMCPITALKIASKIANIAKPSALYFFDFHFVIKAFREVKEADIIQLEQPFLSTLIVPFMQKLLRKPVVIDCHDVFQALRVKHTGFLRRMLEPFLEKIAYSQANLLLTVSEKEKSILTSMGFPAKKIIVVPNGVDSNFTSDTINSLKVREKFNLENSRIVVFIGNLEYLPNIEAIQLISSKIAPKVCQQVKDVKFLIIGKKRETIRAPGVLFTGFVDNIAEILLVSDVGIAPLLQGSGTRLKILEYFSSAIPVVSTSVGAEGLEVKNGLNIFLEDNIEDFATHIVRLLKDDRLSASIGLAGKALSTDYDWNIITKKLETSYLQFIFENQSKQNSILNFNNHEAKKET